MQKRNGLVVLALLLLTIAPASAQYAHEIQTLKRGDRVRVVSPTLGAGRFEATFIDRRGDELVFHAHHLGSHVFSVPASEVLDMEVSEGKKTKVGRKMGTGFLIGSVIGIALGLASGDDTSGFIRFTAEGKAKMGAVVGGSLGLIIGAFKGAATQEETWRPVRVEALGVGIMPDRTPGLVVALDF